MSSRQTFTGFCKILNTWYIHLNSVGRFLSPPVFIKWWFGWTSNMKIDFREICEICEICDYLACNGTKIEMGIGKAFITAIEQRINTPQIKSPSKRYERTFLNDNICALSQRWKEMNDHLLRLAKIVLNELPTNEKLNAEISSSRNATLVSVFPEKEKPLLFQYLHGDGLHGLEQHHIAKFFQLLTNDCAIDVILPYTISDPIRKHIKAYKKRYLPGRWHKRAYLFTQEI